MDVTNAYVATLGGWINIKLHLDTQGQEEAYLLVECPRDAPILDLNPPKLLVVKHEENGEDGYFFYKLEDLLVELYTGYRLTIQVLSNTDERDTVDGYHPIIDVTTGVPVFWESFSTTLALPYATRPFRVVKPLHAAPGKELTSSEYVDVELGTVGRADNKARYLSSAVARFARKSFKASAAVDVDDDSCVIILLGSAPHRVLTRLLDMIADVPCMICVIDETDQHQNITNMSEDVVPMVTAWDTTKLGLTDTVEKCVKMAESSHLPVLVVLDIDERGTQLQDVTRQVLDYGSCSTIAKTLVTADISSLLIHSPRFVVMPAAYGHNTEAYGLYGEGVDFLVTEETHRMVDRLDTSKLDCALAEAAAQVAAEEARLELRTYVLKQTIIPLGLPVPADSKLVESFDQYCTQPPKKVDFGPQLDWIACTIEASKESHPYLGPTITYALAELESYCVCGQPDEEAVQLYADAPQLLYAPQNHVQKVYGIEMPFKATRGVLPIQYFHVLSGQLARAFFRRYVSRLSAAGKPPHLIELYARLAKASTCITLSDRLGVMVDMLKDAERAFSGARSMPNPDGARSQALYILGIWKRLRGTDHAAARAKHAQFAAYCDKLQEHISVGEKPRVVAPPAPKLLSLKDRMQAEAEATRKEEEASAVPEPNKKKWNRRRKGADNAQSHALAQFGQRVDERNKNKGNGKGK